MRVHGALGPRLVVALAVLVFGWKLGATDLWAPDEPFFAEGAREMLVDGHWWVSHVNGEVNDHKPPLFFWLIAFFAGLLEPGSLSARLPSALAAVGSLLLTMRLARRRWDEATAGLAGLVLVTTWMFWDKARTAQIDSTLCFLILVALSAFESWRAGEARPWRAGALFWLAAGLAFLAKGPVGLILPLGIALSVLAGDRRLREVLRPASLLGPLLFLGVLLAWLVPAAAFVPEYSPLGALREHALERAVHGMHHAQPPWYYLTVIPYAFLPWSLALPGALLVAWRRRREDSFRLLLVWFVFTVAFFSISTEKRDLYVLPAVPAFALLVARLVRSTGTTEGDAEPATDRRWLTVPLGAVGFVFAAAALATPSLPDLLERPALRDPALSAAAVLLAGGLVMLVTAVRGSRRVLVGATAATAALAFLVNVTLVHPALNPSKSSRELGERVGQLAEELPAGSPAPAASGLDNLLQAVNLYSGGVYFRRLEEPGELARELAAGRIGLLVAEAALVADLPPELRERLEVVYQTHLSRQDVVACLDRSTVPPPRR